MDARLLVLKLIFHRLGLVPRMADVDDRKLKQKAIYLSQVIGLDLGYRYGWYLMGPYSPGLAKDYYALADAEVVSDEQDQRDLNKRTLDRLAPVVELIDDKNKPKGLNKVDWLELLASWHYLRNVAKEEADSARQTIAREKIHLVDYIDDAIEKLEASP